MIKDCPNCGGDHLGSFKCPYTKAPCINCGEETIYACSDCRIDTGKSVHICEKPSCRDEHEAKVHPTYNFEAIE